MKVDPTPAAPGAVSSSTHVALREHARNSLRPIVEALDQPMTALSRVGVDALALGATPETRTCPECAHLVMRAASRCENCWSKLVPEPSPGPDMRGED